MYTRSPCQIHFDLGDELANLLYREPRVVALEAGAPPVLESDEALLSFLCCFLLCCYIVVLFVLMGVFVVFWGLLS